MDNDAKINKKAILAARSRVQLCHAQIREYASVERDEHVDDFHRDEILQDYSKNLIDCTKNALVSLRIAYELQGLQETFKAIEIEYKRLESTLGVVKYFDEFIGPYNEAVDLLTSRLGALLPLVEIPSETRTKREILELILRQIGTYFEDIGHCPTKEKDVQDHLHKVLRLAFPDIVREPPSAKQSKTYHPDFGVPTIETAIEVKFVREKSKAGTTLGALYEDMKGYVGEEYKIFFALVYMTGNYLTQQGADAELKSVEAPTNWRVIVVVGPG